MVTVRIDNKTVQVPKGTTILDAARQNGIPIPTLCYLKEINEIGACRVCLVELEGPADHCLQQHGGRGNGDLYQQSKGASGKDDKCASDSFPA